MRVLLWLCLSVWAGVLLAAPPSRAARSFLPVAKPAAKPAAQPAKTNEPPALAQARREITVAIEVRDQAAMAYRRTVPPERGTYSQWGLPQSSPGEKLKFLAANRYLRLGYADTAGGLQAAGGLRYYMGDVGLFRALQKAEMEVERRQAVVVAMLTALQESARTNAPAFKAKPAQVEAATVKFLQEQAAAGSGRAHLDLGERLLAGRGVEADEVKGWAHVRAAADLGHEPAQARWAAHQKELDAERTLAAP